MRILVINPGSTSTKFAVYDDVTLRLKRTIDHAASETMRTASFAEQIPIRLHAIRDILEAESIELSSLDCIVGRGGMLHPLEGGVYRINEAMRDDLVATKYGDHASGLGCVIAYDLAAPLGIPAVTVDPVVVDELHWPARYSGHPDLQRRSIFHALNQKAVARRFAKDHATRYDELNLIVAHLGGGVSIGAHQKGKVIDVANAFDGDGPFSPERTGGLPIGQLIDLCFDKRFSSVKALRKYLIGQGGLYAYLGTKDAREVDRRIEAGDEEARRTLYAMCYQIAKEIGALAVVLKGKVDAILLTGGMAYDEYIVSWLKEDVGYLAQIYVYPGEDELEALRDGARAALNGEEPLKEYAP